MNINNKCIAYSDESNHNDGRYRAISLVTLNYSNALPFNQEVKKINEESNISSEFKWTKLKSARDRFAAIKLMDFVLEQIGQNQLRIDTLIWDIEDYRHKNVSNRDDAANMGRMYYHLFKNVFNQRWGTEKNWLLKPDQQSLIDWKFLKSILQNSTKKQKVADFSNQLFQNINHFNIENIEESCSKQEPLIQIADLFAGLAIYSRNNYPKFKQWSEQNSPQLSLIPNEGNIQLSNTDRERCTVLEYLIQKQEHLSLKISFHDTQGLQTINPKENLNFWLYQPQHHKDKAPIKKHLI
jgi:hypothetical protein